MTPELIAAWEFLGKCGFIIGGNADARDAIHMLEMFPECGPRETIESDDVVTMYLDSGNVLDVTLWWSSTTKFFYLGVVGDEEGSMTL